MIPRADAKLPGQRIARVTTARYNEERKQRLEARRQENRGLHEAATIPASLPEFQNPVEEEADDMYMQVLQPTAQPTAHSSSTPTHDDADDMYIQVLQPTRTPEPPAAPPVQPRSAAQGGSVAESEYYHPAPPTPTRNQFPNNLRELSQEEELADEDVDLQVQRELATLQQTGHLRELSPEEEKAEEADDLFFQQQFALQNPDIALVPAAQQRWKKLSDVTAATNAFSQTLINQTDV